MALPKGKLLALVAVFAAIGIAAGTGAFTTVTAERTATVSVTGDSDALLAIEPAPTQNGGAYAGTGSNDQLEIDLAGDKGASGINPNATTAAHDVIQITNQGSQRVHISLQRDGPTSNAVIFAVDNDSLQRTNGGGSIPQKVGITGADNAVPVTATVQGGGSYSMAYELKPGESVEVGIYADTTDRNPIDGAYASGVNPVTNDTELLNDVTIIAANETSTIENTAGTSATVEVSG